MNLSNLCAQYLTLAAQNRQTGATTALLDGFLANSKVHALVASAEQREHWLQSLTQRELEHDDLRTKAELRDLRARWADRIVTLAELSRAKLRGSTPHSIAFVIDHDALRVLLQTMDAFMQRVETAASTVQDLETQIRHLGEDLHRLRGG